MPITKRTTKVVSYNEQEDDDDFIPIVDNTKKNRSIKLNEPSKPAIKQPPRKSDEKLSKSKDEEPVLVLQHPKEIIIDDKEDTNSQITVSSDDSKTSSENLTDRDDQEENFSPKSKRMKHEEEDDTSENEQESSPEKKSICDMEQTLKKNELSSIDLNTSRTSSTGTSDLPKNRSSVPLGFPTSKINIPSPHVPRVGLSRKSSSIKPLHPNFTSRSLHE